jgi:hypothetical protein
MRKGTKGKYTKTAKTMERTRMTRMMGHSCQIYLLRHVLQEHFQLSKSGDILQNNEWMCAKYHMLDLHLVIFAVLRKKVLTSACLDEVSSFHDDNFMVINRPFSPLMSSLLGGIIRINRKT